MTRREKKSAPFMLKSIRRLIVFNQLDLLLVHLNTISVVFPFRETKKKVRNTTVPVDNDKHRKCIAFMFNAIVLKY